MTLDVARFLRLQGAINAAVAAVPAGHAATAVSALAGSYMNMRAEVRLVIDESLQDEFDRLFPVMEVPAAPDVMGGGGFDPLKSADVANQARTRLNTMGGWLDGFVQDSRIKIEAQAYASARIKEERATRRSNL
jgi:hypothetical protein